MALTKYVKDFLLKNHMAMTQKEMAAKLKLYQSQICKYCSDLNIVPVSEKEKKMQVIKEHPEWRPEKIAELFDCNVQAIKNLISKENLRPKRECLSPETIRRKLKENKTKLIMGDVVSEASSEPEYIEPKEEKMSIAKYEQRQAQIKQSRKSFTTYNQTHSPFGFADELKGITATKEVQQFYMENIRL